MLAPPGCATRSDDVPEDPEAVHAPHVPEFFNEPLPVRKEHVSNLRREGRNHFIVEVVEMDHRLARSLSVSVDQLLEPFLPKVMLRVSGCFDQPLPNRRTSLIAFSTSKCSSSAFPASLVLPMFASVN